MEPQIRLELERRRAWRLVLVHLLALLGVPLWIAAAWPRRVPASVHAFLLAAWAVAALASCGAMILVVRSKRRYRRHLQ
jgi:phosphate/sulfate permease